MGKKAKPKTIAQLLVGNVNDSFTNLQAVVKNVGDIVTVKTGNKNQKLKLGDDSTAETMIFTYWLPANEQEALQFAEGELICLSRGYVKLNEYTFKNPAGEDIAVSEKTLALSKESTYGPAGHVFKVPSMDAARDHDLLLRMIALMMKAGVDSDKFGIEIEESEVAALIAEVQKRGMV